MRNQITYYIRFGLIASLLSSLVLVVPVKSTAQAQSQNPFPAMRDDTYPLLGLKRAKSAYDRAKNDFERKKELYQKDLISQQTFDEARTQLADAEVNYQQSMLVLLFEQQFVSIKEAVKYQSENGTKRVRVTLDNTSGGSAEFQQVVEMEDELFRSLQPDQVHNIYVSLSNEDGAIISRPYEIKIDELVFGQPKTVDFELLQDLDEVTVNIIYGNGQTRNPKVFLQKDASANKVLVQSDQFSQEVELGGSASYDLSLELFSGIDNTFKLEVVNLPSSINRYFVDGSNDARLSQIKFTESSNTRNARLQVYPPDRPSDDIQMDKPISFFVLAIPRDRLSEFRNISAEKWTEREIAKMNIGYTRLEMTPRGVGKLLVKAPQLFHTAKAGKTVEIPVQIVNEGTRLLNNVEVEIDPPFNWSKRVEPAVIEKLGIRQEKTVTIYLTPPESISPGKYEARMNTTSISENQPITAEDKTFSVEIAAEASFLGSTLLVLFILALVSGIVFFGIKLSRK